ncbi:hypothetical protein ASG19_17825 [Rhizobium sp. Leaf306]|uniref:hypothetical protein n=1 Tax=Rhizobium sp. Leaf306 TaxID=1736330 RepID=UPI0007163B70|nr:hypothetical protein [Rhizobium sp. Leaf306]KQQ35546.1 hypothetical protein ASG19_17825 [Rhizobium sp. Leaf306]
MDARRPYSWRLTSWEDAISSTWFFFFCAHIGIVVLYRFVTVGGRYLLAPYELTSACFHVLNTFLAPLISIVVFYVLETRIEGVKRSTKIAIVTFVLTLVSNLLFTLYVLSPFFAPVLEGDTLVQRYGEATMLVGMANVAILGPLSAIVFSGDN